MFETYLKAKDSGSAYQDHRLVWEAVSHILPEGGTFLFRRTGEIINIRVPGAGEDVPLRAGDRYRFSLLFNAVSTASGTGGRRQILSKAGDVQAVIARKLREGFDLVRMEGAYVPGRLFDKTPAQTYLMRSYEAHGELVVTNESTAHRLLARGIGKGKRMGYGMLDLRRVL